MTAIVVALLAMQAGLLAYSATRHSPTMLEPAQLAAGIYTWQYGEFDLYSVNPPLVRMIAAMPVQAVGCVTDWSAYYVAPRARPEFALGRTFVRANGQRSQHLIVLARWATIPFSLLGAYMCFLYGRALENDIAGLVAIAIWCLEPNLAGHGHLITTDVPCAALAIAMCYSFWQWLSTSTPAFAVGVVLGVGLLTKYTLILLIPGFLTILSCCLGARLYWTFRSTIGHERKPKDDIGCGQSAKRRKLPGVSATILVAVTAIWVVNAAYCFDGSFRPLKHYSFVSQILTGHERPGLPGNRFSQGLFGEIPLPVPSQFMLGLDLQQADHENYNAPSYLRGEWRYSGWWYYYLYGIAVKCPVAFLGLGVVAAWGWLGTGKRISPGCLIALLASVSILLVASVQSAFTTHFRYVLPSLALLIPCIAAGATRFGARSYPRKAIVAGLTAWLGYASYSAFPDGFTYFNEFVGGSSNGGRHMLQSSLDWGQDLLRLEEWVEEQSIDSPIFLSYWGPCDPADLGIRYRCPFEAGGNADSDEARHASWWVVSENIIYGDSTQVRCNAEQYRKVESLVRSIEATTPSQRIGCSMRALYLSAPQAVSQVTGPQSPIPAQE